jgi:teichuronic acid biosynthesis glycosyltransferase TuaG
MISVIIPNYNRANLLKKAIQSVLEQTVEVGEILICDDGSTDNSKSIVESFKNNKIKWNSLKHSGIPAIPRNFGIKNSTGNWIAFLDSDDTWAPHKIENQIKFAKKYNSLALCTKVENEAKILSIQIQNPITENVKKLTFNNLLLKNDITCSSVLISKKIIDKAGFFSESSDLRAIEDYEYWLRISAICNWYKLENPDTLYSENSLDSIRLKQPLSFHKQQLRVFKSFIFWGNLKYFNKTCKVMFKYVMIFSYLFRVKMKSIFR